MATFAKGIRTSNSSLALLAAAEHGIHTTNHALRRLRHFVGNSVKAVRSFPRVTDGWNMKLPKFIGGFREEVETVMVDGYTRLREQFWNIFSSTKDYLFDPRIHPARYSFIAIAVDRAFLIDKLSVYLIDLVDAILQEKTPGGVVEFHDICVLPSEGETMNSLQLLIKLSVTWQNETGFLSYMKQVKGLFGYTGPIQTKFELLVGYELITHPSEEDESMSMFADTGILKVSQVEARPWEEYLMQGIAHLVLKLIIVIFMEAYNGLVSGIGYSSYKILLAPLPLHFCVPAVGHHLGVRLSGLRVIPDPNSPQNISQGSVLLVLSIGDAPSALSNSDEERMATRPHIGARVQLKDGSRATGTIQNFVEADTWQLRLENETGTGTYPREESFPASTFLVIKADPKFQSRLKVRRRLAEKPEPSDVARMLGDMQHIVHTTDLPGFGRSGYIIVFLERGLYERFVHPILYRKIERAHWGWLPMSVLANWAESWHLLDEDTLVNFVNFFEHSSSLFEDVSSFGSNIAKLSSLYLSLNIDLSQLYLANFDSTFVERVHKWRSDSDMPEPTHHSAGGDCPQKRNNTLRRKRCVVSGWRYAMHVSALQDLLDGIQIYGLIHEDIRKSAKQGTYLAPRQSTTKEENAELSMCPPQGIASEKWGNSFVERVYDLDLRRDGIVLERRPPITPTLDNNKRQKEQYKNDVHAIARVVDVAAGSVAQQLGVQVGDLVLSEERWWFRSQVQVKMRRYHDEPDHLKWGSDRGLTLKNLGRFSGFWRCHCGFVSGDRIVKGPPTGTATATDIDVAGHQLKDQCSYWFEGGGGYNMRFEEETHGWIIDKTVNDLWKTKDLDMRSAYSDISGYYMLDGVTWVAGVNWRKTHKIRKGMTDNKGKVLIQMPDKPCDCTGYLKRAYVDDYRYPWPDIAKGSCRPAVPPPVSEDIWPG